MLISRIAATAGTRCAYGGIGAPPVHAPFSGAFTLFPDHVALVATFTGRIGLRAVAPATFTEERERDDAMSIYFAKRVPNADGCRWSSGGGKALLDYGRHR